MFWVSCLLFLPSSLLALTVENLYSADVYVTSQDDNQLASGAEAGLLQVLIRVSGTNRVQENSLIKTALKNPHLYYNQYSFQSTDREFQIGDQIVPARILRLNFEPSAIARLLREGGFSVWGSNRPSVLLWLAINDDQDRRIISEADGSEVNEAINTMSRQRGLPILYPLLDIEDRLSTAEVWGAFRGRIDQASVRYNPDCVLSGRVYQTETGQWAGNWSYRIDNKWEIFNNVSNSAPELVSGVIDKLSDALASRYAIDSSKGFVELRVEAIDSLADYADITQYLQSLAPVLDIFVAEVSSNEVLFRLGTEGRIEQLIEIIELDEKMMLINSTDQQSKLHYRWLL